MEDLLGFLIPIIGVILWITGMFNSKNEEDQSKPKPVRKFPQTNTNDTGQVNHEPDPTKEMQPAYAEDIDQTSFQDQKKQQMERLKQSIQRSESITKKQQEMLDNSPILKGKKQVNKKQPELSIKNNLTRKGVAQGIIMAEVLGKPRAYKKRSY
ncbi:hypothetical protein [Gracilibacillus xinjiangensis]|uniref:Uncharacterized protein n=1 Tax=Gracilibacillus xinjiangensis TaxID=1193282 RepID=A0ABV8WY20_9BACI